MSAASLLLTLALVEIGVRLFAPSGKRIGGKDRPKIYYMPEDSDTMQDRRFSPLPDPDVFRIAVVGDSFAFGSFLQYDDAFPKRLERLLNLNSSSLRVEVLNLGVPGYSTHNEVKTVKKAIALGAKLVVLQITLNDPQIIPTFPAALKGRLNAFAELKITKKKHPLLYFWKTAGLIASRLHNQKTHREYRRYFFELFNSPQNWRVFSESIDTITELSKTHSVQILAVVFPLMGEELDKNYPFHPLHKKVHNLLKKEGIEFLDLFKAYEGIPLIRLHVKPGVDMHPNEIAHRIAAEEIYKKLSELKLLPEELIIKKSFKRRNAATQPKRLKQQPTPR